MRERKQIEANVYRSPTLDNGFHAENDSHRFALIMEVLLDCRDLLLKEKL